MQEFFYNGNTYACWNTWLRRLGAKSKGAGLKLPTEGRRQSCPVFEGWGEEAANVPSGGGEWNNMGCILGLILAHKNGTEGIDLKCLLVKPLGKMFYTLLQRKEHDSNVKNPHSYNCWGKMTFSSHFKSSCKSNRNGGRWHEEKQ